MYCHIKATVHIYQFQLTFSGFIYVWLILQLGVLSLIQYFDIINLHSQNFSQ